MVVLVDGVVEGMVCDLRVGGRVHMDKAIVSAHLYTS